MKIKNKTPIHNVSLKDKLVASGNLMIDMVLKIQIKLKRVTTNHNLLKNLNLSVDFKYPLSFFDMGYDKAADLKSPTSNQTANLQKGAFMSAGIKNLTNEKYIYAQSKQNGFCDVFAKRNYYVKFKYAYQN